MGSADFYVDKREITSYSAANFRGTIGTDGITKESEQSIFASEENGGAVGIDRMDVEALQPYLQVHREELITYIIDGTYRPNLVRRVEIPKDNDWKRLLGIPTVVD